MSFLSSLDTRQGPPLVKAVLVSFALHAVVMLALSYGTLDWIATEIDSTQSKPTVLNATLVSTKQEVKSVLEATHASEKTLPSEHIPDSPVAEKVVSKTSDTGIDWNILYYYPVNEVHIRPQVRRAPQFGNAAADSMDLPNGIATIELLVERTGKINAVNIIATDLPAPYPEQLRMAFSRMEYAPGLIDGYAVRTRITIEVAYSDGLLSGLPVEMKVHPSVPHVPIQLSPDRHTRKQNPPLRREAN